MTKLRNAFRNSAKVPKRKKKKKVRKYLDEEREEEGNKPENFMFVFFPFVSHDSTSNYTYSSLRFGTDS
jgi:hypothetical protein